MDLHNEKNIHNVTLYNYPDGQQIRVYKNVVVSGYNRETHKRIKKRGYVPWDDKWAYDITPDYSEHAIKRSQNRSKNKIYALARANTWEWFVTFTFDGKLVRRSSYTDVTKKLKNWIDYIRKVSAPKLKYILVPELHKDGLSYHFHGLFSNIGELNIVKSGHKDKTGNDIYNVLDYYLGFSTATKVKSSEKVSAYITKYITKELTSVTLDKKRYWASRNLDLPERIDYYLDENELNDLYDSIDINIQHKKELKIPITNQTIKYIEVSEND